MRRFFTAVSLLAVAGVVACAPANGANKPDSAAMAADLQGIAKVRDGFAAAFKSQDVAAVSALYVSDGLTQPNNQPTGSGPAGIAASFKAFFDQFNITSFTLAPVKTEASGNLGYDIGTYSFTATPKPKGDTVKIDGRYVVVLRKSADGTWKAIADMDNVPTMPPMPAAPAPKKAKGK
jgi:ketosteroid isomerase-like protein